MPKKRIVVALGRNAFGKTLPEQKTAVKEAAKAIADLAELKYQIVITHSNGPQVGMIHMAMTEFGNAHQDFTVAPMAVCSAMSQGYIGYDLQNEIRTELTRVILFVKRKAASAVSLHLLPRLRSMRLMLFVHLLMLDRS